MSDTPRTDAAAMPIDRLDTIASRPCNVVHEDVCQQLERELTEAKFDLQFRRDLYAFQSKELAEARRQRDTLAEALNRIANNNVQDLPETDYAYELGRMEGIAIVALAAVKGGSHE